MLTFENTSLCQAMSCRLENVQQRLASESKYTARNKQERYRYMRQVHTSGETSGM
jgi:hypothetical protein